MPTITGYVYDDAGSPAAARKVRLYRRDTGALLTSGVSGPADEILGDSSFPSVSALLPMNGTSGSTTFTDAKGNVWTPAGGAQISTSHSFFGTGVGEFDGDARITTPDSAALRLATGNFSIELLVRFTTAGVNHVIVNKGTDTGFFAFQVWANTSNQFGFRCHDDSNSLAVNILGGTLATGVNYLMSARRNGSTFSLHVNDTLIGSATFSGALRAAADPFCIGAYGNGVAGLRGYLGQVRVTPGVVRPTAYPSNPWPLVEVGTPALSTGQYSLTTTYTGEVQRIVLDDDAGTLYNDLIDRVVLA
nr:LamG domain-containing protein [uncultured Acidovorax sp.]